MNPIDQLQEEFKHHAETDERNFAELKRGIEEMKQMQKDMSLKLEPVVDVYKAAMLSKGFIVGLASVVIAVGAIGAGFIWLINQAINK